ncbi:putative receptor-like protein kinase [Camellia lanceoleosa]|uniref:Receptor-like protein kinase n=1 Tax=Camellia lanceoleosa TaxID=1840588 RepID=A0ACC0ITK5_9ERIC|nr:putative receptor-like protein kinase [Camellia lanceoleosa]
MRRGISGGQKKRLTTGEMIVGPTKSLFMDEISNGLDSSTTYQIVACLQQLAHITDATILVVLLQPAPETFDLFDDIILMAEGKIVYYKPCSHVLEFFEDCRFRRSERKGVADFLQEVISKKDQAQYWHQTEQSGNYISADMFSKKFKESPFGELLLMRWNSFIYVFKSTQLVIIASVAMTVFLRTRMNVDAIHANYYLGALFYALIILFFDGFPELSLTVGRLAVFYKQRDLYFYPAWAYAIPATILKVPISLFAALIWTSLTYYVVGYSLEAGRFFLQFILFLALHLAATFMFRFVASVFHTAVASTTAGSLFVLFVLLFSGFIIPKSSMPTWLKWGFWVSPLTYGEVGLAMIANMDCFARFSFSPLTHGKEMETMATINDKTVRGYGDGFCEIWHLKVVLVNCVSERYFDTERMTTDLNTGLSKRTAIFGLKVWELIGIFVGLFIIVILFALTFYLTSRKKSRKAQDDIPISQIPTVSKEIKEVRVEQVSMDEFAPRDGILLTIHEKSSDKESDKVIVHLGTGKTKNGDNSSQSGSFHNLDKDGGGSQSGEVSSGNFGAYKPSSSHPITASSPLTGLPEFSHLGWGHWFTLRDLELATNRFSKENVIGEGGYGVVYRGCLINGSPVAVKRLLNNLGQAEKEFRVEVEAIGHVRHKNLVRLLGYCMEGTHRLLVYEYVNNGNLEQWLHGAMRQHGHLTWEARMKVLLGTAKALGYLHEAIEPKVVHRDIKSSNILIDDDFNAKVSDFGLAKLLGAGKSHITTRVMGTFGYVAPEYANSGLLNEKSDVYSFGVVLLEAITGRDPVDYGRAAQEVNLVDWLKMMVGSRRSEEVVDPNIETKPSTRALKRALLTALRCVDPDSDKRPKMSQVVRMLESEEYPIPREDRRHRRAQADNTEIESQRENYDTDKSDNADPKSEGRSSYRT